MKLRKGGKSISQSDVATTSRLSQVSQTAAVFPCRALMDQRLSVRAERRPSQDLVLQPEGVNTRPAAPVSAQCTGGEPEEEIFKLVPQSPANYLRLPPLCQGKGMAGQEGRTERRKNWKD